MKFFDLLLMSISNLWKRKLRTVLTILGVVIGITSIVVMVALGNGLKESMLENYSSFASMTQIQVSGGGYYDSGNGKSEEKRLDDNLIEEIKAIEHVSAVYPRLNFSVIAKSGKYTADFELVGATKEDLESLNLPISKGKLPDSDTELKLFYGNTSIANFRVEKTNSSYWQTGVAPDVDLMESPIFVIFDTEAYWNSKNGSSDFVDNNTPVRQPKKYIIKTSGIMEGGIDDWNNRYCMDVLCDIDALKKQLKQIFKKNVIPGQPTRKNGKPYNEIFYSSLIVQVDNMENVQAISDYLKDSGYDAYSSSEWIQSEIQTMNMIQAVLGAIGAVAMLVAAISITNTMMMSIYERTKEIGVMKVLGCDIHNIQTLFLLEAGFIGFIGGIIGVLFSYGIGFAINTFLSSSISNAMGVTGAICRIPLWLSPSAIVFAVVIGMIAGFIPSLRAMKLSPLAAIRNE